MRMFFLSRALVLTVTTALAGCAIVSSERFSAGAPDGGQGIAYALPMARLPVVLSANAGQIILRVDAPLVVADPDHHYTAQRVSNPFSSDQVTIEVDPNTSFLSSVNAVGKDETLTVLEKLLVKSAAPEAAEAQGDELYRTEVDPADPAELAQESAAVNQALASFLDAQAGTCTQAAAICAEYAAIRLRAPKIQLSGRPAARLNTNDRQTVAPSAATADCRVGVCYRQHLPFVFKASFGETARSVIVNIPNASPVIAVPLERHPFVTTTHTLAFEQGALKSATVDRPSSALALVSSPLAAVSGVINSITKPLSELLKIDTSGQYEAKVEETKAKAEEAKADKPDPGDGPTPPKTLVTLTLGTSHTTLGLTIEDSPGPANAPSAPTPRPGSSSQGSSGTLKK